MERGDPTLSRTTPDPSGGSSLRDRALGIVAFATVLALLYFGRDVLIPAVRHFSGQSLSIASG